MDSEQMDQSDSVEIITDEGIVDDNNLVEVIAEIDDDEQDSVVLMDVDRGEVPSSESSQDGQFSAINIEETSAPSKDDEKSNKIKETDSEDFEVKEKSKEHSEKTEKYKLNDEELKQPQGQNDERFYPKTKRELKSLLELSKEAKLLTNLANRRKTIDNNIPTKTKEKTNIDNKQKRSVDTLEPVTIILHSSITKKQKSTTFPITAESELESNSSVPKKRKKSYSWTGVDGSGAVDEKVLRKTGKMMKNVVMLKPNKDMFCWRCHHPTVNIACETCPRSYHQKCLKQTVTDTENWQCFECVSILKAENIQTRSKAMQEMTLEHLCSLLKFAVKRMINCSGSEPFMQPVDENQFPEYKNYVINPMDLTMLEKNIKNNVYGSTQAFEADAKWILHNSIIFNSYQSRLTVTAKILLRICKQEMSEIENCSSCYLNANTKKKTWFIEVCPKPHLLVWAKLKGFPYWPAKVMTITPAGMVDVRFFGAHDKSWVPIKDCLLYSVQDPNSTLKKKNDIMKCVKELNLYVENLKKLFGQVNFAPFKTPLETTDYTKQLKLLVPSYKEPKVKNSKIVEDDDEESTKLINRNDKEENEPKTDEEDEDSDEDDDEEEEDDEDDDDDDYDEEEFKVISNESENNDDSKLSSDFNDSKEDDEDEIKEVTKPPPVKIKIIRRSNLKRKRSSDSTPERPLKKIAKRNEQINKEKEKSEKNDDKKKADDSPSKLKITDELIKKLENIEDAESEKNSEKAEKVKEVKKIITENKEKENLEAVQITDKEKEVKKSVEKAEEKIQLETNKNEKKNEQLKQDHKERETNRKNNDEIVAVNKMVKLVPIQNILEKELDSESKNNKNSKCDELLNLKEISIIKDGKQISKKTNTTNKQTETTNKNMNNDDSIDLIHEPLVTIKVEPDSDAEDDDVQYMEAKRQYLSALNISEKPKNSNNNNNKASEIRTRSKTEEKKSNKTIVIVDNVSKIVSNVVKRKPAENEKKGNDEKCGEIYIKPLSKMQTPKHKARKSFPVPNYNNNNNNRRSQPTAIIKKILPNNNNNNKNTSTPQQKLDSLTLTNNLVVLPTLHYTKPSTNNTITVPPQITNESSTVQNDLNNRNNSSLPIDVNNENISSNNNSSSSISNNLSDSEFATLKEILPENVSKDINEILCQPPPRLKPKPIGPLSGAFDSGVPSTAGPVASKINANAQKLSDYFRGLLVETIDDLGKSNSPEATMASLRLKIEEQNHKHSVEMTEIKRNITIVLKDIQKSIVEERERIVNETKANCEIEMMKRVEEAKSKQWCANCFKEAQFYCCWNTSYCDYPCQQKHWLKHMSKCSQAVNNQSPSSISSTSSSTANSPHLILANTQKTATGFPKPQKVYVKKSNTPLKQAASGGHITLVESTPGNFELVGNGPISVNGKILASTSIIEKMKSGNITVTSTSTSSRGNNGQKTGAQKPTVSLTSKTINGSDMNT